MPNNIPAFFTIKDVIEITGGHFAGYDNSVKITGIMPLNKASSNDIAIFDDLRYRKFLDYVKPALIIVKSGFEKYISNCPVIVHDNPHSVLPSLLKMFEKKAKYKGISKLAYVSQKASIGQKTTIEPFAAVMEGAEIGKNCFIASHAYIGENSSISDNSIIYAGVKIQYNCIIGKGVIVHPNSVVGADGYGYYTDSEGNHIKIPQIGRVIIEDEVEIGSNVSIDRGTMGDTVIGRGTKIDNLVQIAHNVVIGENCLIISQVGISGSVNIGNFVVIAGQAGVAGHLEIPSNTKIGGRSAVLSSIEIPGDYSGHPLLPINEYLRNMSAQKKLHEIYRDIKMIKKKITQ